VIPDDLGTNREAYSASPVFPFPEAARFAVSGFEAFIKAVPTPLKASKPLSPEILTTFAA